jgi:hypothetical protein
MGGKQLGFSDYELTTAKKQTKREKFRPRPFGRCKSRGPIALIRE